MNHAHPFELSFIGQWSHDWLLTHDPMPFRLDSIFLSEFHDTIVGKDWCETSNNSKDDDCHGDLDHCNDTFKWYHAHFSPRFPEHALIIIWILVGRESNEAVPHHHHHPVQAWPTLDCMTSTLHVGRCDSMTIHGKQIAAILSSCSILILMVSSCEQAVTRVPSKLGENTQRNVERWDATASHGLEINSRGCSYRILIKLPIFPLIY